MSFSNRTQKSSQQSEQIYQTNNNINYSIKYPDFGDDTDNSTIKSLCSQFKLLVNE